MRHALHIILALTLLLVGCYSDPLISIAIDYYDDADNLRYRGMAHYYKARVLYNNGDYEQATEHLIMAEEATHGITAKNTSCEART